MSTSQLEQARLRWQLFDTIYSLVRNDHISGTEINEIPQTVPSTNEELTEFIQQLFSYGLGKYFPGCPVRAHDDLLSVRLDGIQNRQAQEMISLFAKNGIRTYINEHNRDLFRLMERANSSLRNNGHIENKEEEGRKFYHIPFRSVDVSGMRSIYQSITQEGKSNESISRQYDTFMGLVERRNEERRAEFIQSRTRLHNEYMTNITKSLTIPLEAVRLLPNGAQIVAELQAAGLDGLIKKPNVRDLVKNDVVVDVFSDPSEQDETWRVLPVAPAIITSTDQRVYHGQGVVTQYDPNDSRAKDGLLPFVVQHCLRVGADLSEFIASLPADFQEKLNKSNEIYERLVGQSSEGLDVEGLINSIPKEEKPAEPQAPRRRQSSSANDELTAMLRAQLGDIDIDRLEERHDEDDEDEDDEEDELPFEQESVVEAVAPSQPTPAQLADELRRQLEQQQSARERRGYHEAYGTNPIFVDKAEDGSIRHYYAFQGNEGRQFDPSFFNPACIYAGKSAGEVRMFDFAQRMNEPTGTSEVWVQTFNGQLI